MTVEELIKVLETLPPDLDIIVGEHAYNDDPHMRLPAPREGYVSIHHNWWFDGECEQEYKTHYKKAIIL